MPEYTYCCEKCSYIFSVHNSIKEYSPQVKCPKCMSKKNVHRSIDLDNVYTHGIVSLNDIKKVGHYAERQSQQLGKYELESMRQNFVTKKEEKELPKGFSKLTKEEYLKMPSRSKKKRRDV